MAILYEYPNFVYMCAAQLVFTTLSRSLLNTSKLVSFYESNDIFMIPTPNHVCAYLNFT